MKRPSGKSGQLSYFEELGLRNDDREALFNTNIVVINETALREKFSLLKDVDLKSFLQAIAPDVISNTKEQDGKKFIQLESALGSVMLNLDRHFREHFDTSIVSIVNVSPEDREGFFIPIKKREDYDRLTEEYVASTENYRVFKK